MRFFLLYLIVSLVLSCDQSLDDPQHYLSTIEEWRTERLEALNAEDGWLSLVGLYRIDQSQEIELGSGKDSDLVLPDVFPEHFGTINVVRNEIQLNSTIGFEIGGQGRTEASLIPTGRPEPPTVVEYGRHQFIILDRSGEYFLRLRDLDRPARHPLKDIPQFEADHKWVVSAQLLDQTRGDTFQVKNILGQDVVYESVGLLEFQIGDEVHGLVAFGGSSNYFVMISDETTSLETYGGGRYLYVPLVDDTGTTIIDFNKAENPPCVFTDFATCPLPPQANHIPFRVTAGEQMFASQRRY